jgi:hypothetical protein
MLARLFHYIEKIVEKSERLQLNIFVGQICNFATESADI